MKQIAVVVPLKRFDLAKNRLRQGGEPNVTDLARQLASAVVQHCAPHHVIVVSESHEVSDFAHALGVEVIESDARDLNDAIQRAYAVLTNRFEQLMIVHGDLKYPAGLGTYQPDEGVTIVTDHHQRGTNVLALPTGVDFRFSYGSDSRRRHEAEAGRLGLSCRVVTQSPWAFDVDDPEDLTGPA
ncbi:MAG: CofC family guanylyltransferase [Acidimicrobiales bacterium]